MSDGNGDDGDDGSLDLAGIVTDQVTEQLDAGDLLGGGSIQDQIDAGEVGASVGSEFGARVGREFGEEIGGDVHATIASGIRRGAELREIGGEIKTAVREAIVRVASRLASREALATAAEAIGSEELGDGVREALPEEGAEAIEGATKEGEEATPDRVEDDEEQAEGDEEEDERGEEEGEGDAGENDESDGDLTDKVEEATPDVLGGDDETPAPEDLEGLRRETLEDFLDVMSYRDLQSVAKDVDVKANLSREEMTEEIIETVSDEGESEDEE